MTRVALMAAFAAVASMGTAFAAVALQRAAGQGRPGQRIALGLAQGHAGVMWVKGCGPAVKHRRQAGPWEAGPDSRVCCAPWLRAWASRVEETTWSTMP